MIIKGWILDVVIIPLRHVWGEPTWATIDWVCPDHSTRAILSPLLRRLASASSSDAACVPGEDDRLVMSVWWWTIGCYRLHQSVNKINSSFGCTFLITAAIVALLLTLLSLQQQHVCKVAIDVERRSHDDMKQQFKLITRYRHFLWSLRQKKNFSIRTTRSSFFKKNSQF